MFYFFCSFFSSLFYLGFGGEYSFLVFGFDGFSLVGLVGDLNDEVFIDFFMVLKFIFKNVIGKNLVLKMLLDRVWLS